jgi:hypothetical protein
MVRVAGQGTHVVAGPEHPQVDDRFADANFETLPLLDVFDARGLASEVHEWIDRFELERPYPVKPPLRTEVHRKEDRDAVLFVINPTTTAHRSTIRLPRPTLARDLMSGEEFEGEDSFELRVEAKTVRMLELDAPSTRRKHAPKARRSS